MSKHGDGSGWGLGDTVCDGAANGSGIHTPSLCGQITSSEKHAMPRYGEMAPVDSAQWGLRLRYATSRRPVTDCM